MKDYRFDMMAYGLRKDSCNYPMSSQASKDLETNEPMPDATENLWDDIWKELHADFEGQQP